MHGTVEVRIPAYRRPKLLHRALASLQNQTYSDWRCVVLDDAVDDPAAEQVCASLADKRVEYRRNDKSLGIEANIDQAFSLPYHPHSVFACVLEDDNYYMPDLFEHNIR